MPNFNSLKLFVFLKFTPKTKYAKRTFAKKKVIFITSGFINTLLRGEKKLHHQFWCFGLWGLKSWKNKISWLMNEAAAEYIFIFHFGDKRNDKWEHEGEERQRNEKEKQRERTVVIHILKLPDSFCSALTYLSICFFTTQSNPLPV